MVKVVIDIMYFYIVFYPLPLSLSLFFSLKIYKHNV